MTLIFYYQTRIIPGVSLMKAAQQNQQQQHQSSIQQRQSYDQQNRQRQDEKQTIFQQNTRKKEKEMQLQEYNQIQISKNQQQPMREQQLEKSDNGRHAIKKQRVEKDSNDEIDEHSSQGSQWLENNKNPSKSMRSTTRQSTLKDQGRPQLKLFLNNEKAKTYGSTQPKNGTSRTRAEAFPSKRYDSDEYDTMIDPEPKVRKKSKQSARKEGPGEVIDLACEMSSDSEAERDESEKVKSAKAILSLTQTITGEAEHLKLCLDSLKGNRCCIQYGAAVLRILHIDITLKYNISENVIRLYGKPSGGNKC